MADKLGSLVIAIAGDLDPLARAIGKVPKMLGGLGRDVARKSASVTGDVLKMATGFALADPLKDLLTMPKDFVKDSVRLAAGLEKSTVQFEVLLGNAADARDLLADVKSLGVETGLGFERAADESKKLLAAGVGKDQITPTLLALSDITMGDKEKIGRASLAYGQVKATGYVQGDELNQLTELGIPIKDAIAKFKGIAMEEFSKVQEARGISFRDLQGGLRDLTSDGGKFFRMSARGADTLDGQFGKLEDAIDDLKREFGKAIIEETGLRDMLRDGTGFAREMREYIDLMRPGIRFVGDTIKGVGHVVAELVRHGPLFGEAFVASLRHASPMLADLTDAVARGVQSLRDFKLDPRMVVQVAKDIGTSLGRVIDYLLKSLGDGLGGIYNEHVKPIVDALKDAAATWKKISDVLKAPADLFDQLKRDGDLQKLREAGRIPDRDQFVRDRVDADGFGPLMKQFEKAANRNLTLQEIRDPEKKQDFENWSHFMKEYIKQARQTREQQLKREWDSQFAPEVREANAARDDTVRAEDALLSKLRTDLIPQAKRLGRGDGPFVYRGIDLGKQPETAKPWSAERAMADASKAFEQAMDKLANDFIAKRDPLADPQKAVGAALAGPFAIIDPAAAGPKREEFRLDDVKADPMKGVGKDLAKEKQELKLPSSLLLGSREATEQWQRAIATPMVAAAGGKEQDPEKQQVELLTQLLAVSTQIARSAAKAVVPGPVVELQLR